MNIVIVCGLGWWLLCCLWHILMRCFGRCTFQQSVWGSASIAPYLKCMFSLKGLHTVASLRLLVILYGCVRVVCGVFLVLCAFVHFGRW